MSESLQMRVHGDATLPTLVYLPGLHGDWTLIGRFRAALAGHVRFVEFTYPRTLTWSLDDYAQAIHAALGEREITTGWLLGESFGSQIAWQMLAQAESSHDPADKIFHAPGLLLVGGFVRHPSFGCVRLVRLSNRLMPLALFNLVLFGYAQYARLRHGHTPGTAVQLQEFLERRTELDRRAIVHRYGIILGNDLRPVARRVTLPVYYLSGWLDPIVPWPFVRSWLKKNCRGFRGARIIGRADHNVLGSATQKSAEQIVRWISAPG